MTLINSDERHFHAVWCSVEMRNKKGRTLVSNMSLPGARDPTPTNWMSVGVVFIWKSKSNWFCICYPTIGLKKLAPIFYPIRSKTQTNRDSFSLVFPRFVSSTWVLIGLLYCLWPLWLASVTALVLVLWRAFYDRKKLLLAPDYIS